MWLKLIALCVLLLFEVQARLMLFKTLSRDLTKEINCRVHENDDNEMRLNFCFAKSKGLLENSKISQNKVNRWIAVSFPENLQNLFRSISDYCISVANKAKNEVEVGALYISCCDILSHVESSIGYYKVDIPTSVAVKCTDKVNFTPSFERDYIPKCITACVFEMAGLMDGAKLSLQNMEDYYIDETSYARISGMNVKCTKQANTREDKCDVIEAFFVCQEEWKEEKRRMPLSSRNCLKKLGLSEDNIHNVMQNRSVRDQFIQCRQKETYNMMPRRRMAFIEYTELVNKYSQLCLKDMHMSADVVNQPDRSNIVPDCLMEKLGLRNESMITPDKIPQFLQKFMNPPTWPVMRDILKFCAHYANKAYPERYFKSKYMSICIQQIIHEEVLLDMKGFDNVSFTVECLKESNFSIDQVTMNKDPSPCFYRCIYEKVNLMENGMISMTRMNQSYVSVLIKRLFWKLDSMCAVYANMAEDICERAKNYILCRKKTNTILAEMMPATNMCLRELTYNAEQYENLIKDGDTKTLGYITACIYERVGVMVNSQIDPRELSKHIPEGRGNAAVKRIMRQCAEDANEEKDSSDKAIVFEACCEAKRKELE